MNADLFRSSLGDAAPPAGISQALAGLWWDHRGDWDAAHRCAQAQDDAIGAAVHAYLHRKEGDMSNAAGWYARAGRPMPSVPLDDEWAALVAELAG